MLHRQVFLTGFLLLFSLYTWAQHGFGHSSTVAGSNNVTREDSLQAFADTPQMRRGPETTKIPNEAGDIANSDGNEVYTLTDCIRYALKHQPALNQSFIDEAIAKTNNGIAVSNWLPQVNGSASITNYIQGTPVITSASGSPQVTQNGSYYTSIPGIAATQTIFNTDVLLAVRAAKLNTLAAQQNVTNVKITLVSEVSKAFYDMLLSVEQIYAYRDDSARLEKNKSDTYNQYVAGTVDKVDYMQAVIALNNTLSQLKTSKETVQSKYAVLKQYMGYRPDRKFTIQFDTAQMMQDIYIDTVAALQFEKRIEYQQLQTQKRIQRETTAYYQLGFLPSVSAFYDYNYEFENNHFSDLYGTAYPYSLWGLQLNIPIFTGLRRIENIHKSKLMQQRIDWDEVNLELAIYADYRQSMSNYKSNLYFLQTQTDNVKLAREVYNIVRLQYREGIKAYLDVIIAENDLITAQISYLTALFQVLESKVDLEKSMGNIPTEF